MVYKDKGKQRQADRARQQRRRDKIKAKGVTFVTPQAENVTPKPEGVTGSIDVRTLAMADAACGDKLAHGLPANYGHPDCQCMHCKQNRMNGSRHTLNHGPYKPAHRLSKNELNRVTLPGDPDYVGVADNHPEWPRVR